MVKRVSKCTIGIQDNYQNTYRRYAVLTSIRKRGSHPSWVELTSYKVDNYDERRNGEAMRLQLDLVDEVRMAAEQRLAWYGDLMAQH